MISRSRAVETFLQVAIRSRKWSLEAKKAVTRMDLNSGMSKITVCNLQFSIS